MNKILKIVAVSLLTIVLSQCFSAFAANSPVKRSVGTPGAIVVSIDEFILDPVPIIKK